MLARTAFCLAGLLMSAVATPLLAQRSRSSGLIPVAELSRNGLKREWFTQIRLNPARGHVVGVVQHVSSTHAMTIYEVKYKGGKLRYLDRQFDRFGDPLGKDGAKQEAERKAIALTQAGFEPKVEEIVVPEITLYASTSGGMIHAIDGETGRTKWTALIGKRNHPTLTPAANDKYVAVINGSFLYMLDRNDGRQLWSRSIVSAPRAGPAISDDLVFVPTLSGKLQSFLLKDYKEPAGVFQAIGRSLVQPIITSRSVAWPTDRGHLYVAPSMKKGIRYRIEARGTILSPASFRPPSTFFMTSVDGYVYCFFETNGAMIWNYSIGESISQTAVPIGNLVYVVTEEHNLYALDLETGEPRWTAPNLARFIAGSERRLYLAGVTGRLKIVDAQTGALLSTIPTESLDLQMMNMQTDRIFIGSTRGVLQCLREVQNEYPILHLDIAEPETDPAAEPAAPAAEPAAPAAPGGVNPFGEKNPFGGADPAAKPAPAEKNPFGGGKDPFGAGADPFGGGGDPFKN